MLPAFGEDCRAFLVLSQYTGIHRRCFRLGGLDFRHSAAGIQAYFLDFGLRRRGGRPAKPPKTKRYRIPLTPCENKWRCGTLSLTQRILSLWTILATVSAWRDLYPTVSQGRGERGLDALRAVGGFVRPFPHPVQAVAEVEGLVLHGRPRPRGYPNAASASPTAVIVRPISASVWARETNPASNCDGAMYTPRSSRA